MSWHWATAYNFCIVFIVYSFMYLALYTKFGRRFAKHKYNSQYPRTDLVHAEIKRSFVSVAICCCWEAIVVSFRWHPNGCSKNDPINVICTLAGLFVWIDTHFYFMHRLLHVPILYRHIHKVHHESINPDPWSGLSFHPVEAFLYFSSLLICCVLPIPHWAFCLHKTALLVAPANGHHGHKIPWLPDVLSSDDHFIHHAKFTCNYGSPTCFWDYVFDTQYEPEPTKPPKPIRQVTQDPVFEGLHCKQLDASIVDQCLKEMRNLLNTKGKRKQNGRSQMVEFGHQSNKKVLHVNDCSVQTQFPKTIELVLKGMELFDFKCKSVDAINFIVRRFDVGDTLPFHVDYHEKATNDKYHFYDEEIFGCILENTSDQSLTFKWKSKCMSLHEEKGTLFMQKGPIRFEAAHGVCGLTTGQRVSLTWRFINNINA